MSEQDATRWFRTWWDPEVECQSVWDGRRLSADNPSIAWKSSLAQAEPFAIGHGTKDGRRPTKPTPQEPR